MNNWEKYGSVVGALALIRKTKRLIENYSSADSSELDKAIQNIESGRPIERKDAFWKVAALCHPKAYGDFNMKDIPGGFPAWHDHLEKLRSACISAYRKLEKEFEGLDEESR